MLDLDDAAITAAVNKEMKSLLKKQLSAGMLKVVDDLITAYPHGSDVKQRQLNAQRDIYFPVLAGK